MNIAEIETERAAVRQKIANIEMRMIELSGDLRELRAKDRGLTIRLIEALFANDGVSTGSKTQETTDR